MAARIRKDDMVVVIAGDHKGARGKVLRILGARQRVLVEGVNKVQRHTKANPYTQTPGGINEKEAPVHASNVAVMCDACSRPTRIGSRTTEDGKKVRFCRKCNEIID